MVKLVSQLLCPLAKEKRKSCPQNVSLLNGIIFHCLLLNKHLQINSLVLPPCSLNTISSQPYHQTKLISRFENKPEFFKKVWKDSLKRFPKNYMICIKKKTFFDGLHFVRYVKKNLPGFLLVLHFLDYLNGLQNPEILKNVWKVRLKRYPKYSCFNLRTSWHDWIFYLSLNTHHFFFIDLTAFK